MFIHSELGVYPEGLSFLLKIVTAASVCTKNCRVVLPSNFKETKKAQVILLAFLIVILVISQIPFSNKLLAS
ncbi:DUF2116 family Zn-ribbon domain-containing protein [Lactobacillus crispatus]|nr:DUF2116 family Zn-ribbon domain-containing protein [Lactobacillus crispatus]